MFIPYLHTFRESPSIMGRQKLFKSYINWKKFQKLARICFYQKECCQEWNVLLSLERDTPTVLFLYRDEGGKKQKGKRTTQYNVDNTLHSRIKSLLNHYSRNERKFAQLYKEHLQRTKTAKKTFHSEELRSLPARSGMRPRHPLSSLFPPSSWKYWLMQ